ncbi:hypothetical protein Q5752_002346 [Cryptotrichosporon argae]
MPRQRGTDPPRQRSPTKGNDGLEAAPATRQRHGSLSSLPRYEDVVAEAVFTKRARIMWSIMLGLPMAVSILFLCLATSTSAALRTRVAAVSVSLPSSDHAALSAAAVQLAGNASATASASASASAGGELAAVRRGVTVTAAGAVSKGATATSASLSSSSASGELSLGPLGWCVSGPSLSDSSCSDAKVWYTVADLLDTADCSGIKATDIGTVLVHTLILNGIALCAVMLAAVPLGLYLYRRYWKMNREVTASLFQMTTLLVAMCAALFAFVFDEVLKAHVATKLSGYAVATG